MITLFNIPNHTINTSNFSHVLHDEVVKRFERQFADYVGAEYSCFANSASSLIFLSLLHKNTTVKIPSIMPIVVPNMIINSGNKIEFYDDVDWVGKVYKLHDGIWDSAQQVSRNQFSEIAQNDDVMIFSFYPTKPVSGCDGGMVVSNNKELIDNYRMLVNNGCDIGSSWSIEQRVIGYKMHGSSIQAYIAHKNFQNLDKKNLRLHEIASVYNKELGYNNSSLHLYRIRVKNNKKFIENMKQKKIQCGIHYHACHKNALYLQYNKGVWGDGGWNSLPNSEKESRQTVSIPFHENLTSNEIDKVIENVKKFSVS